MKHGTPGSYNNGKCRCARCQRAWAEYLRERARQRGRPAVSLMPDRRRLGLVRRHGESVLAFRRRTAGLRRRLRADEYFASKVREPIAVRPTALGLAILDAAQARTGRGYDDIVEQLLRQAGASVTFREEIAG